MNTTRESKMKLPQWLNGQTVAIIAVVASLGAMTQAGFSNLRMDIDRLRTELRSDFNRLEERLRAVEVEVAKIGVRLTNVEGRLTNVEGRLGNVESAIGIAVGDHAVPSTPRDSGLVQRVP